MIPLWDNIPRSRFPVVVLALIIANCAAFVHEISLLQQGGERAVVALALVPAKTTAFLSGAPIGFGQGMVPLFTSMFLHGGWMHLIGNMWFLWIFGDNVEDRVGHGGFLILYLVGGLAGGLTHWFFNMESRVPTMGASGAIAAVMGAYLITFPGARIRCLVPIIVFLTTIDVPAFLMLIYWLVLQLLSGVATIGAAEAAQGGVAFFAHVGGFVAGIPLMLLLRQPPRARQYSW